MLGWYLLAENTTMPEMEWMLARAAGYDAGFAMVARPEALRKNPLSGALLDAIREWEAARTQKVFSASQREALKSPKNEFHLEKIAEGKWNLHTYAMSPIFSRERFERQPGEPTHTTWNYQQSWREQPLQFRMSIVGSEGSAVKNIKIQIDRYKEMLLPLELSAGESLVSDGTELIRLYDKNGKPKKTFKLDGMPPTLAEGAHVMIVDSQFNGEAVIEVQFKGLHKTEQVAVK
jgi:hypothetical protein